MQGIIYVVVVCFIIWLVVMLLPIILPIVLILIAAIAIYIWNMKRKIVKHMDEYSDEMHSAFQENTTYFSSSGQNSSQEDIIDVEFSEHDVHDD